MIKYDFGNMSESNEFRFENILKKLVCKYFFANKVARNFVFVRENPKFPYLVDINS